MKFGASAISGQFLVPQSFFPFSSLSAAAAAQWNHAIIHSSEIFINRNASNLSIIYLGMMPAKMMSTAVVIAKGIKVTNTMLSGEAMKE